MSVGDSNGSTAVPEIPAKQKAAIYDQPGTVSTKVVEIDVPEPGVGEVLINLYVLPLAPIGWTDTAYPVECIHRTNGYCSTHSGVCHSDLGVMTNTVSLQTYL